jgi:hypothetical protein
MSLSFLSSATTASAGSPSLSASFLGSECSSSSGGSASTATAAAQGWMYWRRESGCWLKVFAVLRHELLWLARSDSRAARRAPLLQIAVADVQQTAIGGFRAAGPSGESMELYLYDPATAADWLDALRDAAQRTLSFERAVAVQPLPRRQWKAVEKMYTGTLVLYNQQRRASAWRRFWAADKLRAACRLRLEHMVDRLDSK